jgi:fructose-1,6-bisphosphatase I
MPKPVIAENLTTLAKHLRSAGTPPGLIEVVEAIALAGKTIARSVRRARIDDVIGGIGKVNVQGEAQEKMDVLSDDWIHHSVAECSSAAVYASEEQERPDVLREAGQGGEYCVLSDPLDGSSNIDVAVSVGTIFSVLPNREPDGRADQAVLQAGNAQVAAGYILYGSSVVLVLATGRGVDMYVLDPALGDFVLVEEGLRVPAGKKIYSINEAYTQDFDAGVQAYLEYAHGAGYGARYIGSMVADVHRTLLKGGVFLYPATAKAPDGKLRLMYEGNPMAMVIERAGGAAYAGAERLLDVEPGSLHQRIPVLMGCSAEVDHVRRHAQDAG